MNQISKKVGAGKATASGNDGVAPLITEEPSESVLCDVADAGKARRGRTAKTTVPTATSEASARAIRRKGGARGGEETKAGIVMKKLRQSRGATVIQLMEATGWQAHSVRGFLSAAVRKKAGLDLVSEVGRDGLRRYRIVGESGKVSSQ